MYLHIFQTLVVWLVEVSPYLTVGFVVTNVVEVSLEPVHKTVLGLAHVLDPASLAGEAVDEIRALARHIVFRDTATVGGCTCHPTGFVDSRAVSAIPRVTGVAGSGAPLSGYSLRESRSYQSVSEVLGPSEGR